MMKVGIKRTNKISRWCNKINFWGYTPDVIKSIKQGEKVVANNNGTHYQIIWT